MHDLNLSSLYKFINSICSIDYDADYVSSVSKNVYEENLSRNAIEIIGDQKMVNTPLRSYAMMSSPSSDLHPIVHRTTDILNCLVCMINPKKILIEDHAVFMKIIKENNPNSLIRFINSIHLYELETHFGQDLSSYLSVKKTDIVSGNFDTDYDLAIVNLSINLFDELFLRKCYDHVSVGGSLILTDSSNHGMMYIYKNNHYLYHFHKEMQGWPGAKVSHFTDGIPFSVIRKEL